MKLTKWQAEEIQYRLEIVADEEDLLESYEISPEQAADLIASVPDRGEWDVPSWAVPVVLGELENVVDWLRGEAGGVLSDKESANALRTARGMEALARSSRRMGKKAAQAFEDGWFDALEDNLTMEEYWARKRRETSATKVL